MSLQLTTPHRETSILGRLMEKVNHGLSPEAARYLLSIRFEEQDIARINELSELARQGALSAQEEEELDNYIHVGNLLGILQSRARRVLRQPLK
ncbi:MAG: hypothetical protein JO182_15405 [Acidobacteriaceae bacterium]|nr:hypothetical protein [Acidobacteriaceae bacterium]